MWLQTIFIHLIKYNTMSNYDDLLREKEKSDLFDDSSMEKHWAVLENKMDTHIPKPGARYRKIFITVISVAAVLIVAFFVYTQFKEKPQQTRDAIATVIKSSIMPPLNGVNVPYEIFSFDAAAGDTLFTLNGSIIIFPKNAVLNSKGEMVKGNIEVRAREFNDPFDYSIAGIPMDYDSAGVKYQFISSAMIDITAYQNGEPLQVNPAAKPQLNLVSTNKERKTNLYKLDTVSGKWMNRGKDEVNLVDTRITVDPIYADNSIMDRSFISEGNGLPGDFSLIDSSIMLPPPQKASNLNPLINIIIDPASFKELLVYDGLKFEVIDARANTVGEDSKTDWDNIELIRGEVNGTYKVIFSEKNKKVTYHVKPVLEGKDFVAAEKLYQEKLKEYTRIQKERKKEEDNQKLQTQQNLNDRRVTDLALQELEEDNKRVEELNKLIAIRNKFIEAENIKILALNKENKRRKDSATKANSELAEKQRKEFEKQMTDVKKIQEDFAKQRAEFEKQRAIWEQNNRTAALQQNLIRSFQIDGFGYWNCDQPTSPQTQQYIVNFKTENNEAVTYTNLCIAAEGINRLQNYYNTNRIGLINNGRYFGWAYNENRFYYFTRADFNNAKRENNTIAISMNLYEGDVKNYNELKAYIFNVNSNADISKK